MASKQSALANNVLGAEEMGRNEDLSDFDAMKATPFDPSQQKI